MHQVVRAFRRAAVSAVCVLGMTGAALVGMAIPGDAAPATYTVKVDGPPPSGEPWDFMAFFPDSLAVHAGDTVNFAWNGVEGPHTVTLTPEADAHQWRVANQGSTGQYQLFIPDSAAGGDDNNLIVNPLVVFPSFAVHQTAPCGSPQAPCSFDGSAVLNSGIQFSDPSNQPGFSVQIAPNTPPGEYAVLCLLHPGMEMNLYVEPQNATIESPAQVAADGNAEYQHALTVDGPAADAKVQRVHHHRLHNGHVHYFVHAGAVVGQASADEYPDRRLVVHRGDRITIVGGMEIHNLAFPFAKTKAWPFTETVCEQAGADKPAASPTDCANPAMFRVDVNPRVSNPSTSHRLSGNQVRNSGVLGVNGADGMTLPFPRRFTFMAGAAGRYHGLCDVHGPMMDFTLTVKR